MPAITCQTVLDRMTVLSYNVRSFRLRLVNPSDFEFQPGQFVIVHVPKAQPPASSGDAKRGGAPAPYQSGGSPIQQSRLRTNDPQPKQPVEPQTIGTGQAADSFVKRAYSIASPPHEKGVIELCIQHVEQGAASTFFWQLKEGMPVTVSGPHGRFTLKEPLTYQPVFMATGTGVAPFRSMIQHLYHLNVTQQIWLLFGTRYEHGLLYEAEFRALASLRHNFHYLPTVSRPKEWTGAIGHIQQTFQQHIREYADKEIYVCGWLEVVKAVVKDLSALGVPPERIHYEEW